MITPTAPALGRTVNDFCDQLTRSYLDRYARTELDRLRADITGHRPEIVTQFDASGLVAQTRIELDNELMHVWAHGDNPGSFVVERGVDGTVGVPHQAGAMVRVNPRWPRIVLAEELAREVRTWPASVGLVATGQYDVAGSAQTIDLDGLAGWTINRVLRTQRQQRGPSSSWPGMAALLELNQDPTVYPSGAALRFPWALGTAGVVRVSVLVRPDPPPIVNFDDDLGLVWHLNDALVDAAMFGVAGRLLAAEEIVRTSDQSQGRPRIAEEVPPGHRLQAGQVLLAQRDQLLKAEAERIYNEYPPRYA